MSYDIKGRIRRLEQRHSDVDTAQLAALLRRANGAGSVTDAITSLEKERGRSLRLDPAFRARAERTWNSMRDLARALFAVAP